jgi:hypothetical protein
MWTHSELNTCTTAESQLLSTGHMRVWQASQHQSFSKHKAMTHFWHGKVLISAQTLQHSFPQYQCRSKLLHHIGFKALRELLPSGTWHQAAWDSLHLQLSHLLPVPTLWHYICASKMSANFYQTTRCHTYSHFVQYISLQTSLNACSILCKICDYLIKARLSQLK